MPTEDGNNDYRIEQELAMSSALLSKLKELAKEAPPVDRFGDFACLRRRLAVVEPDAVELVEKPLIFR